MSLATAPSPTITPVILAGGAGTRLWPLSRQNAPKQMQALVGDVSMLAETLLRFTDRAKFGPAWLVTSETLGRGVIEQLRSIAPGDGRVLLEPMPRSTAPAIAAAALLALEADPAAVLLVAPADHSIRRVAEFRDQIAMALPAAVAGRLVTFSMTPTRPETGYGYIRHGQPVAGFANLFQVAAFVEKPNLENAIRFLADGNHYWNSGMFLFSAKSFVAELEKCAPDVLAGVHDAVATRTEDGDFVRLGAEAFSRIPPISIDYAVMEKSANVVTIPCDIGWTDVGSWAELWNVSDKDQRGNVVIGDAIVLDSRNTYVRGENQLVAASGLQDIILVATKDAVLAVNRNAAQDIRPIVETLNHARRSEAIDHLNIQQSWGIRRLLLTDGAARIRQVTINPGKWITVQSAATGGVHLVVTDGAPVVTGAGAPRALGKGQAIDIPPGTPYRLENPRTRPADIIELQLGTGFRDDDIVSA